MNRKSFYQRFNSYGEIDEFLLASIYEIIQLCKEVELPIYSNYFYPPIIWNALSHMDLGVKHQFLGINHDSEKKMICFYFDESQRETIKFPVKYFNIKNKSKFRDLEHKDYLGSIMSLGIKRELVGDLIVKNGSCYGIINSSIFDFLMNNIGKIGKNPSEITEIQSFDVPDVEFEEKVESITSMRLDAIISTFGNISRNKAVEKIENGDILVNYLVVKEKNFLLKIEDTITIRKLGKFSLSKDLGVNRKGKKIISFKIFC